MKIFVRFFLTRTILAPGPAGETGHATLQRNVKAGVSYETHTTRTFDHPLDEELLNIFYSF